MLPCFHDQAHLSPLLEFIRFVSHINGNSHERRRMPKRLNGSKRVDEHVAEAQLARSEDIFGGDRVESSSLRESNESVKEEKPDLDEIPEVIGTKDTETPQGTISRKRSRSSSSQDTADETELSEIEFEFITEKEKGNYTANYVDIPLSKYGAPLLLQKVKPRHVIGNACCYLKLGSSFLVTGRVVDSDLSGKRKSLCVTPDRGVDAAVDWVDADRVFVLPPTDREVRRLRTKVNAEMKRIVDELQARNTDNDAVVDTENE